MVNKPQYVVQTQLVDWLRPQLVKLVVGKRYETMPEARKVILTTFDQLREATRTSAFPDGLDFTSTSRSDRIALYDSRVELAELGCWFAAEFGVGIKWTADSILGIRWFNDMQMERAENRAEKAVRLWEIARDAAPARLHSVMSELLVEARDFRHAIDIAKLASDKYLTRIESGEAGDSHPYGTLTCSECGQDLQARDAIILDGRGGYCHNPRHGGCPH